MYAPLNTSIHVSGSLISSRPDYKLQHPYGGQVEWVGIRPQQHVKKGQPLLRINFAAEQKALQETRQQIETLNAENALISSILNRKPFAPRTREQLSSIARLLQTESRANAMKVNALRERAISLTRQISGARAEISLLYEQLVLLKDQETRQQTLRDQSLARASDVLAISKQILAISGQQERRRGDVTALNQRRQDATAEAHRLDVEFRAKLLERLSRNEQTLSKLRSEIARLDAMVATEIVRSPIDGHVHSVSIDTELAFATRGETLVTLAQNLEAPKISLQIPVSSIDQVKVGMSGQVMFSSLPQRGLPPVFVTVTAISPTAKRDQSGAVTGYSAEAELEEDGLQAVMNVLKEVRLSADMPVSVTLSGRQMTFAQYFIPPVNNFITNAFQD